MREEYDFSQAKRGAAIKTAPNKVRITIRLDANIIDWFRQQVHDAGGGNYQTLMNEALREHISRSQEPLEQLLRRVVREELKKAS